MATISLKLLGGLETRAEDGRVLTLPTQKYRALLAFLASPPGRAHPRESLVALLWGDLPHEQARGALRQALWALRRALNRDAHGTLVFDGDSVVLDAATLRVDVREFEQAASRSDLDSLARAAALYRGDFLAGLSARERPFEEWLAAERERLAELALGALARLLARQRDSGALDDAVQTALRLLALDPLQEVVHRTLMQLYVQLGRRGAALRQYQSCVGVLQRELSLEPEPETRALYQQILRQRSIDGGALRVEPARTGRVSSSAFAPPAAAPDLPLIGRDHELTLLRDVLKDVTAGRGHVVAVVGEAGIGKSRLVAELLAEAGRGGARVLVGRAHESDQVLPFGPWADAFGRAQLGDGPAVLAALQPAWRAEIARLVPELGRSEPVATPGAYDYAQLFEGVARLLAVLSARCTLVIALEDLHWADDMSLRLVTFVARRIQGRASVLLLLTARGEEIDAASPLQRLLEDLDRELPLLELRLAPLPHAETLSLVRALSGGRDGDAVAALGERIWSASEGHPFMVVEMMRAGSEAGDAESASGLALPQRVRRLIERRLQRLSASARQLVATAAVIGRDFDYALLQPAAGVDESEAVAGLEELVRRRVLHMVGDRFEFTHDRLREVAYALLLPPRRKLLHRRIAETLEGVKAEDRAAHIGALGAHYAEAEIWERAAPFLHDAAEAAYARSAFREGAVLFERALGALVRLPRSRETILLEIDVRLRLHRCLYPIGAAGGSEHVARARALLAEVPDERREALVFVSMSELARYAGDLRGALEAGQHGVTVAIRTEQPQLVDQARFQLGAAHLAVGAYEAAIAQLQATIERLAPAPLQERLGYPYVPALCRLSWALADVGDYAGARRHAQEAVTVAEAGEHVLSLAEAFTAIGLLELAQDQPGAAMPALERASELADSWHITHARGFSMAALALAYARCGRNDEARSFLDECERRRVWEDVRMHWARVLVRLGHGRRLLGDAGHARRLAEQALELARSNGQLTGEAEALELLAEISLNDGPAGRPAAARSLSGALAIADRVGLHPLRARVRSALHEID
jgi:DNA-binding SARP family transcriptional activator